MSHIEKHELFPIPVWISRIENYANIKNDVVGFLEREREKDPEGSIKSNWGGIGYRSKDLTHCKQLAPIFHHVLNNMVKIALNDCNLEADTARISSSWCMFNDRLNAFNSIHAHHGVFSGIFYASAPEGSGELVFRNEGFNELWHGQVLMSKQSDGRYNNINSVFPPEEGMIIMWNSYVPHFVTTNHQDVNRISISFNVDCEYTGAKRYEEV